MRNSKFLLTSLLAAATMVSVPAWASNGDTVLINFNSNKGTSTTEGTWNNTTAKSNASGLDLVDSLNVSTGMTATWNATGLWHLSDRGTGILNGYLDDNARGSNVEITINVSNVSYLVYDVTIYCAADGGADFSAKTVNGATYSYSESKGGIILGDSSWGALGTTTPSEGTNCLTISGLGGDLSISSLGDDVGGNAAGKSRGNIAAIKIVNTGGEAVFATLSSDAEWTSTSLAGTAWTNATDENRYLAHFTLGSTSTLNVTGTNISTTAIIATTADGNIEARTLTLSGNAVSLIGPAVVRTDSTTASIVINNTLDFAVGGRISGNVSTGTNGSLNVTGGTLSVHEVSDVSALAVALSTDAVLAVTGTDNSTSGSTNLTKVAGEGKIEFAAAGVTEPSTDDGAYSWVKLSDQFTGTLSITSGVVDMLAIQGTSGNSSGIDTSRLGGATLIELNGGGLLFRNTTKTFNKNISVASGNGVIRVYGAGNVTLAGNISGTGTLTHTDGGTLKFSGDVDISGFNQVGGTASGRYPANTEFSGDSVRIGTLNVSGASATFSGASTTITTANVSGGVLNVNGTTTTIGTLNVTGGAANFNSAAELSGVYVTGGTLNLNSSVEVTGRTSDSKGFRQQGGTVNLGDGTNAASLTVVDFVGSSDGRANGEFNIKSNAVMTVTGAKNNAVSGFAHSFQIAHWPGTETFNVAGVLNLSNVSLSSKDGTGIVNVTAGGELNLNAGLAMAVYVGSVTLNLSGGTMNIGANGIAAGQTLNLNSGTIGSLANSWTSSRDMALGGAIVVDTTKKIYTEGAAAAATASGSEVTLNGVLSDASGATGSLTKRGAGTLTLSGNNTYTGGTVIEAGTVVAAHASALGTTKGVEVKSGAALKLGTSAVTVAGLSGAGTVGLASGTTSATLTVDSATDSTFSGSLEGAIALVKQGAGTLELSGNNTMFVYPAIDGFNPGVDVRAGTVRIVQTGNFQSFTNVSVADGATLELSTVSDAIAVNATSVVLSSTAKILVDMSNYASDADIVAVNLISASALSYGSDTITSNNVDLLLGAIELKNWGDGWTQSLSYAGSTLTLTLTIPEPSAFGLLAGLGALALAGTRRRRKKA